MCSDGFFFAVKEVSLLATGNQGQQSIFQLEQVGRFCNAWIISSTFWGTYKTYKSSNKSYTSNFGWILAILSLPYTLWLFPGDFTSESI